MKTGNEPLKRFHGPQATEVKEWGESDYYIQFRIISCMVHCIILSIWGQISILHLTAEI